MAGRPRKMDKDMRQKLEDAAAMGCTDTEIALYCDISRDTLYRWFNEYDGLSDRIVELRERPVLLARQTLIDNLENPQYALEYLKRKRKAEFSERQESTGKDGEPLMPYSDEQLRQIAKYYASGQDGSGEADSTE